jgi:2'-hydroxyisoflavone reductase
MRVLVIGGTVFVGRAVVAEALARGDEVTVFHRGRHGVALDGAEAIHGDRELADDLARLRGREWDVVVDTCGFEPAHVIATARVLAGAVGRYVFVSTAGVYRDWPERPITSVDAPLHESDVRQYSELKAACERALDAELPGRVAHVRPGIIVGPHENIGRLPWWLERMARGGRVMAPGPPDAPFQVVDVRDLAVLALDAPPGAYNAVLPPGALRWGDLLEACRDVTGSGAELVWTEPERVLEVSKESWNELPMWPTPEYPAVYDVAASPELRTRPLIDTVADTRAWLTGPDGELSDWRSERRVTGLDPERERTLLS